MAGAQTFTLVLCSGWSFSCIKRSWMDCFSCSLGQILVGISKSVINMFKEVDVVSKALNKTVDESIDKYTTT